MGRVVHFEISADDPQRAVAFYQEVFGWKIDRWGDEPYWLVSTGEGAGIDGALMPRGGQRQPVIDTVEVESWDRAADAVRGAGGKVLHDKRSIPGVGTFAYCEDTEGNVFGIMEPERHPH